ncbi:hypothetical protein BDV41DRAFT_528580 [Aspergillus transmontanensis]|uniref:Uncharacterized protein n=1 Tax=Aspergillus transmontanensis TaxID=1034304 RepID=A0A5N6W6Y6_9EURO|nr:hypothetical protein BDV41DRAFT_528580 [Aspergillus transmontanensis]
MYHSLHYCLRVVETASSVSLFAVLWVVLDLRHFSGFLVWQIEPPGTLQELQRVMRIKDKLHSFLCTIYNRLVGYVLETYVL